MSDYTPGPWTIAGVMNSEPRDIVAVGYGGVVGCTLTQEGTQTIAHGGVYRIEDARLIAAAPDLLALVRDDLMGLLDGLLSSGQMTVDAEPSVRWVLEDVRNKARVAIAKATDGS